MKRAWGALVGAWALLGGGGSAFAMGALPGGGEPAAPARPNVLIIVADDLGYGDVGAYGSTHIQTPYIDQLAADGVQFTQGYVTAAVCSPSRAGFMTGRYQARFGHEFNMSSRQPGEGRGLPLEETTIAERMKAAGYRTGLIGKWHLGADPEQLPSARGFDFFYGFPGGAGGFLNEIGPGDEYVPVQNLRRTPPVYMRATADGGTSTERREGYLTDVLTDEAVDFIEAQRAAEDPFFLVLTHYAPHVPLEASAEYVARYAHIEDPMTRVYAAMVAGLDDSIGRLIATLEAEGLAETTMVAFFSDNGCAPYIGDACSNAPLNGWKRFHLEGGIRVPMILRYAGLFPEGAVAETPVLSLDVMATALDLAGADRDPIDNRALDGRSLVPLLTGAADGPVHERLYWRTDPNFAVREGRWKLWVVDRQAGGREVFLFDLEAEAFEATNRAAEHPEIVARLTAAFEAWNEGNVAPLWTSGRTFEVEVNGVPVTVYN